MTVPAQTRLGAEEQRSRGAEEQRSGGAGEYTSTPPHFHTPTPPHSHISLTLLGSLAPWLLLLGTLLGAGGWWLPWVLHPNGTAALVLLGLDLGEFFKFTSLWDGTYVWGQLVWERHAFFLPPAVASLSLSLLVARASPRWRVPATTVAALLALVLFPELERRGGFFTEEFWFQVALGLIGLTVAGLVLVAGRRLPLRGTALATALLASVGAVLPLWAFWRVELVLEWLYGTQIVWGPGLWISVGGFTLAAIAWARIGLNASQGTAVDG